MTGLQFTVGAEHAAILDAALAPILRRYREAGMRAPADIEALAQWARVVKSALSVDLPLDLPDDAPVALLLSLPDVATELACSVSKVKKIVADGLLATVDFDGVRRVHRDDLDAYVQGLRARPMIDRLEVKAPASPPAPRSGPRGRRLPDTLEAKS